MKFKDVMYYHGGAGEKGKDIVCWKDDEIQARLNYALVVKSQKIIGQAKSAKGTAGEVATQIQQVFGSPFTAPITAELLNIHICWVVTNKEISKEGMEAIISIIKPSNYDRHVKFIDGDALWKLVEQYLGNSLLWGKMEDIQAVLNDFDTHYQPQVTLDGEEIKLGIKEKFQGASKEKPLDFHFSFEFPDTPEGISKRDELERHIATGSEVSIPAEYIKSVELPDTLKNLFDLEITNATIVSKPIPSDHHFIASLEFASKDGDLVFLDYVDFQLMQKGTKEATLENVEKGSLLKIKLIFNQAEKKIKINFHWKLENPSYSCSQLLEFYELLTCISKPFSFKLISKQHNVTVFSQDFEKGIMDDPPSSFYLESLHALSILQKKSNKVIMVPSRELTDDEIKELHYLMAIVRTGKVEGTWTKFNLTLKNLSLEGFNGLDDGLHFFRLDGSEVENIFDAEIPLGVSETVFRNALIGNLEEIRKAFNSGERDINLEIVAQNGKAKFEKTYKDFINKEEKDNSPKID